MYGWNVNVAAKPVVLLDTKDIALPEAPVALRGLWSGALVLTPSGWQAVARLAVGDLVHTFDNGLRPIRMILATEDDVAAEGAPGNRPVFIPAGAMGNLVALVLPAGQGMLVEDRAFKDPMGDPFGIVPAAAFEGLGGVKRHQDLSMGMTKQLFFDQPEAIYLEGGFVAHCPQHPDAPTAASSVSENPYLDIPLAKARTRLKQSPNFERAITPGATAVLGINDEFQFVR